MLGAPETPSESRLRTILKYSWFAVLGVALIVGLVLYSRWDENHRLEQQAAEKKREQDARDAEMLGGNRFEILQFYAYPASSERGADVHLCYGVSNAKTVKLEPVTEPVWPSVSHCVIVNPKKTTTYTLTVADANGQTKTQSVTVQVR